MAGIKISAELALKLAQKGMLAKDIADSISAGINQVSGRFEAMQDLSRRAMTGGSQSAINQAGAIALEDAKLNDRATKEKIRFEKAHQVMQERSLKQMQASQISFLKNMSFASMPLLNPMSVWGNMFAVRQMFSAFSTQFGQGLIGRAGLSGGTGAAAATGGLFLILEGVGLALKALEKIIKAVIAGIGSALQAAHKLFSDALTTGAGTRFAAMRAALSNVLGVPANQAFSFSASKTVMPLIADAVKMLGDTARPLANVAASIKIFQVNVAALWASLASGMAESLNKFVNSMTMFAEGLVNSGMLEKAGKAIGLFFDVIRSELGFMVRAIGIITQNADIALFATRLLNPSTVNLPSAGTMKQLPASHFEKMGLVLNNLAGGGVDYARRTAHATEGILKHVSGALPRTGLGPFSPAYNQP